MTLIYRVLLAIVLIFTLWNLFTEGDLKNQANAALVLIPLLLRILMIK
ncbi:MAG: hypothetical protein GXW90_02925 [Tepidanaerobacter acetatoxydans]|nr:MULTISPECIES: hypothetical protein [Tepidanaerobacter]NLU09892.1 hypothetical protein [Tepidanaerobacter acetatoxydans]